MSHYARLPPRRRKFVDAYVRLGVGSDAYLEAYPGVARPDAGAWKLLQRSDVKGAIAERTEQAVARAGVRQVRVLEELAAIAFLDPGELFEADNSLHRITDLPEKVRRAILAVETDELFEGVGKDREQIGITRKVKLHPKIEALKLLGQHLKLFAERHELSGPNGGPIAVEDSGELSDLDRARRVAFVLARGLQLSQAAASAAESGNPAGDSTSTQQKAGDDS